MGRKAMVPYGLYRAHGFFNPHFAKQTGADGEDLACSGTALQNMFDLDRSSARGMMASAGSLRFQPRKPARQRARAAAVRAHLGRASRPM